MNLTKQDLKTLEEIDRRFISQLSPEQLASFNRAVEADKAYIDSTHLGNGVVRPRVGIKK